jgi:hypothetical protein
MASVNNLQQPFRARAAYLAINPSARSSLLRGTVARLTLNEPPTHIRGFPFPALSGHKGEDLVLDGTDSFPVKSFAV